MRNILIVSLVLIIGALGACGLFDQKPVCSPKNPNCNTLPNIPTQDGHEGAPSPDSGITGG